MRFGFLRGARSVALLAVLGIGWPVAARALDCAFFSPSSFESIDTSADPAKKIEDLEARAALANLSPIVFSGRLAGVRSLGGSNVQAPVELFTFLDVKILRGELPRSRRDGKAVIAFYGWCDGTCPTGQPWMPGTLLTIGTSSASEVVKIDGKVVYHGRVDGASGPCASFLLSPLQLKLIATSPEEISRLEREYPRRERPYDLPKVAH